MTSDVIFRTFSYFDYEQCVKAGGNNHCIDHNKFSEGVCCGVDAGKDAAEQNCNQNGIEYSTCSAKVDNQYM